MLKKTLIGTLLFTVTFFLAFSVLAADAGNGKQQTLCPVQGGKIDRNVYTDYQGKRIYFCCSACIQEFKKDPEKYMKKLQDEGVVLEKAPGAN